jgi:hypothetical protein
MKSIGSVIIWNRIKTPSRRLPAAAGLVVAAIFAGGLVTQAIAAGAPNACQQTAIDARAGCRAGAQSDYQVALGKCVNLSDPAARKACEKQAAADLADAQQTCQGGFASRTAACQKLGPAPYDPLIDPANFSTVIDNPFFPLMPGTTFIYLTPDGVSKDVFAVTHDTRVIDGVTCVVVHDSVFTNDVLTEETQDFFAQDKQGNVWYFGENTAELEDGLIATIAGSFLSGANNDKPGIIQEAHPAIGDFYRQEFALQNAEDFAQVVGLNSTVVVPYGTFTNCLKTLETTPLEPDASENKYYAAGVGNILTVDLVTGERDELVQIITE